MTNTGNEKLLEKELTVFLCSRRCPDQTVAAVDEWLKSLNPQTDCILCGGLSGVEKRVVVKLMENEIPLIWMQAGANIGKWHDLTDRAIKEGRLLLMTENGEEEETATVVVPERNDKMIEMASKIVVAYMDKGGKLEKQLEGHDNVKILVEQQNMKDECFCIRRDGGNIYFDMERGMSGKYIKISQTRKAKNGTTRRECVFINAGELGQLKKAVEWALTQMGNAKANNTKRMTPSDSKTIEEPVAQATGDDNNTEGLVDKLKSVFGFGK